MSTRIDLHYATIFHDKNIDQVEHNSEPQSYSRLMNSQGWTTIFTPGGQAPDR